MFSELPVFKHGKELVEMILRKGSRIADRTTIVKGEAGSGKSTGLPVLLAEKKRRIYMAEPTRLGVFSLAQRVAQMRNCQLGHEVGYRHAAEQCFGKDTEILFAPVATVFNQLVWSRSIFPYDLCIDEAHLMTRDVEFAFAFAKKRLRSSKTFRLIVSSATIDSTELSDFFGGAEVFSIEGRNYNVREMAPVGDLVECAIWGIKNGLNVLFFERGVEQIHDWLSKIDIALKKEGLTADTIALHSNAGAEQQRRCFERNGKLKIIGATNYAETSVTLPNIGLVIDTGMHNRLEVNDGVEGLFARAISLASRTQRKCRTGRELDGIYMDLCKIQQRDEYDQPEIYRSFLSSHLLRVLAAGRNFAEIEFFHQPPEELTTQAFEELRILRLVDKDLKINELGKRAAFLGVSPQNAAMLLEADSRGVLSDIIPIVALKESGGLMFRQSNSSHEFDLDSDLISESNQFRKLLETGGQYCANFGVNVAAYQRTADIYHTLLAKLNEDQSFRLSSSGIRKEIMRAILAGRLNQLYRIDSGGKARKVGSTRICNVQSKLSLKTHELVVGDVRDFQNLGSERYSMTRKLCSVTRATASALLDLAEPIIEGVGQCELRYDPFTDQVQRTSTIRLFNEQIDLDRELAANDASASEALASWLANFFCQDTPAQQVFKRQDAPAVKASTPKGQTLASYRSKRLEDKQAAEDSRKQIKHTYISSMEKLRREYASRIQQIRELNTKAGKTVIPELSAESIINFIVKALNGACHIKDIVSWNKLSPLPIPKDIIEQVDRENPSFIELPSGKKVQIDYKRGPNPQVSVSDWWRELPDEKVTLPGGREIHFVIFGTLGPSSDVAELKRQAAMMGY